MVTHASPVAVQRGTTSEVMVYGQRDFRGAYKVLFEGTGIRAEVIVDATPPQSAATKGPGRRRRNQGQPVPLKVTVDADAVLGPREFRIATDQGLSTVGQLVVSEHPVVREADKHADFASAQPIPIPSTIAGIIAQKEEMDVYKIEGKAGQQLVFCIESARLMDKVHDLQTLFDPILTLFDSQGRELASNDDYFFADALLACRLPTNGVYYLQVRDVSYNGDGRWNYALVATDRPYVTASYPFAFGPKDRPQAGVVGFNLPASEIALPLTPSMTTGVYRLQPGEGKGAWVQVNAVPAVRSPHATFLEKEPNHESGNANAVKLPVSLCGRIEKPGDVDVFAVTMKKGESLRLEATARRIGSSLDAMVTFRGPKFEKLAENDDGPGTKDSLLTVSAPADGTYYVEIRDLLFRGGDTFGYVLDLAADEPTFDLVCDDDKLSLGPGTSGAWFVRATRRGGFAGPIDIRVEGLPAGVSAAPLVIPPNLTDGCLILTAAANAASDAAWVRVTGRATHPDPKEGTRRLERVAAPLSEIYLPGGGRGLFRVATHGVAVAENFDLAEVRVTPASLALRPGDTATLAVEIVRREKFTGTVTLALRPEHLGSVYNNPLPQGVTIADGSKTTIAANETKGTLILKVAPDAPPCPEVPLAVLANVSINFVVKRPYSSLPVMVQVLEKKTVAAK